MQDGAGVLEAQSRTLRNSLISLAVFFAIVVGLLLGVPGLQEAAERISDANLAWVAVGVGFEVLSCAGYVVLFELVFGRLGRSLISRLSLSELAVNSVVSVSGLAGIALGAWVLRSKGFSVERIAKRSVLIFVLTSAVNVGAVAVIGVLMWLGRRAGLARPAAHAAAGGRGARDDRGDARAGGVGAARGLAAPRQRPRDGRADGRQRRGGRRAEADPRARLAAARRGRLLAVRQPRAVRVPGRLRPRAVLLGRRDGLSRRHARELAADARRLRRGRRRAGGDAAAVRRATGLAGDRGGRRSTARSRCGCPR